MNAKRADGEAFHASVTLVLYHDRAGAPAGVVGISRDVTEQRQLRTLLRASEERYRLIAEQATDVISIHTRDSEWIYASPSVEAVLGFTPEELLGKEAYLLMDPAQARTLNELEPTDFLDPHPEPIHVVLRHKDGHDVHLESKVRTLTQHDPDAEPRLLVISRDVTERVRREEERLQLEARLQDTQRRESLALLAGGLAHDFNNLLLVVLANADLLAMKAGTDAEANERIEAIRTAAERAGDLTRQMLAYAGRGEVRIQPIQLTATVQEMSSLIEAAIPRYVHIERAMALDLPEFRGDLTELRQVILNLITNAAESISPSGGTVYVRTGACRLSREEIDRCVIHDGQPGGDYVFLEVRDTGSGMDEQTLGRIFDPFFTTKFQGRGLGLATVLGIIRRHRAALAVESKPGEGTSIRVYFAVA